MVIKRTLEHDDLEAELERSRIQSRKSQGKTKRFSQKVESARKKLDLLLKQEWQSVRGRMRGEEEGRCVVRSRFEGDDLPIPGTPSMSDIYDQTLQVYDDALTKYSTMADPQEPYRAIKLLRETVAGIPSKDFIAKMLLYKQTRESQEMGGEEKESSIADRGSSGREQT